MRKFFLLIPALVLSLFTNAAVINITPTSPHSSDNLRQALASANSGDIIEMAAGTYVESNSNYIAFTGKNVTVRAAEGAEVILQPQVMVRLKEGATARFEGIKFDCSRLNELGSYSNVFVAADANDANNFGFENCEFYNYSVNNSLIYCSGSNKLASVAINNCYFHNLMKSCLFIENTTNAIDITITNSTFANIETNTSSHWAGVIDSRATSGSFLVDHCTFYNVNSMSLSYGTITVDAIADPVVSNCIFMLPSSVDRCATNLKAGGDVTNCLTYNYDNWQPYGHYNTATVTDCVKDNPLFIDPANNIFTVKGDWTTTPISLSPARGAATDGSDLGDPRWYSAEILPETNFASPGYFFDGPHAKLIGRVALDANNYIKQNNNETAMSAEWGIAIWKIHSTSPAVLEVTLNMDPDATASGHNYQVEIFDAEGNSKGALNEGGWHNNVDDKTLTGTITLPTSGDYKVVLTDNQEWSTSTIKGVTLVTTGGAVQAMPGTTDINDAWFSANGTRADGKIDFPDGSIQDGWVKWNVAFANAGNYNVIVNIDNANGHNYTVALYEDENDNSPIIVSEGGQKSIIGTLELGKMEVPAGNYILKVTNAVQWSDAKLISVKFEYKGGGIVTIPGSIDLNEAILSERAFIDGDGLHFADADHLGHISQEYAKWNIHVAADGMYKFTANCSSSNYSNLTIQVLQGGEEKYSFTPEYTYTGEKTINSPEWFLEAGDYELRLSNPANHSNGYLVSLSAAQVEGILIVDEMATDMQYITDVNSKSMKPLLKRSFTGGMYNTVVFPFNGVTDAELTTIFGAGYELLEMTSATLEGNTLNLNFSAVNLSQATYGRPYLIKPTQDVVNPMFSSKTIYASTSHLVNSSTNADFIGSFIAGEVPAGEDNLFLGPNNLLYFYDAATPIKGTRAYFHIKGVPHPSQSIKHAKIITNDQVVTSIDFTKGENNKVMKAIENGQLIIIRNGERFTVQGQRIQ